MAKFSIHSASNGAIKYTGTPTYTGQYMKPGMLEFREICSPYPIEWEIGDYVDYAVGPNDSVRTGYRYCLFTIPKVKRQARNGSYGGTFVYQNVQLFDPTYLLGLIPFRDLVVGDNRIHFSTQPSISVFDNVAGIAERVEACILNMYPNSHWRVVVASNLPSEYEEYEELMDEDREFSVSGVSLLGVFDKIYEVWPKVGWVYSESGYDHIITLGPAGLNENQRTYAYGKGLGLLTLERTQVNANELANRIYPYGSMRNVPFGWYRGQEIKDAESVDIQHLMLPIEAQQDLSYPGWGLTDNLPDASKAFVEDGYSISQRGILAKTAYFDGSGEYKEIYPSIEGMTIADVRASSPEYYPDPRVMWDSDERVDMILIADGIDDDGQPGNAASGALASDFSHAYLEDYPVGTTDADGHLSYEIVSDTTTVASTKANMLATFLPHDDCYILADGVRSARLVLEIKPTDSVYPFNEKKLVIDLVDNTDNVANQWLIPDKSKTVAMNDVQLVIPTVVSGNATYDLMLEVNTESAGETVTVNLNCDIKFQAAIARERTFTVWLRQIGFDITKQAALGEGKTMAMLSGKCAGRSFPIKSCLYNYESDCWKVELVRTKDESTDIWYPNKDYPVQGEALDTYPGDRFVLLDIAMPDSYIITAGRNLILAAKELLADTAVERWQYSAEVDAKYMANNGGTFVPGQKIALIDTDIISPVDGTPQMSYLIEHENRYFLTSQSQRIALPGSGILARTVVDTVTISEDEAEIPTFKVTFRDTKRKKYTEASAAQTFGSIPVEGRDDDLSLVGVESGEYSSFFELSEDGKSVKLKDQYEGMWAKGWVSAGGIGSGSSGGGGGGGASYLYQLGDVDETSVLSPSAGDILYFFNGLWRSRPLASFLSGYATTDMLSSYALKTDIANFLPYKGWAHGDTSLYQDANNAVLGSWVWANNTGTEIDNTPSGYGALISFGKSGDYGPGQLAISSTGIPYFRIKWGNSWLGWYGFVTIETDQTITGLKKFSQSVYVGFGQGASSYANRRLYFGDSSHYIELDADGQFHFSHALYSDSFVSAGGIGSGGGGGGGSTTLAGLSDVSITGTPSNGAVLYYDNGFWRNRSLSTLLGDYVTISGAQTITGQKTFTNSVILAGASLLFKSADSATNYGSLLIGNGHGQLGVGNAAYMFYPSDGFFFNGGGVQCGASAHRWSNIYSVNGNFSGIVTVNGFNTLDQSNATMSLFNYGARLSKSFNAYGTAFNMRVFDANDNQVNLFYANSYGAGVQSYFVVGDGQTTASKRRIYFGDPNNSKYIELDANGYFHIHGDLYVDGFVSAGGVNANAS